MVSAFEAHKRKLIFVRIEGKFVCSKLFSLNVMKPIVTNWVESLFHDID